MMKRPAFQFYPADWRKDVELQSCSMAAQGLWINVMCIAHECEPYGHLTVNGKPMTTAQLGRHVGLSAKEVDALISELESAGVSNRSGDGCIYSRRMVRDERLRNVRADSGRLGGNPNLLGNKVKQEVNQIDNLGAKQSPTPSSSSSSSSSSSEKPKPLASASELDTPGPLEAEVCARLEKCGIQDANPNHAKLKALLQAGLSVEEIASIGPEAAKKRKSFAWILAAAEGRRRDSEAVDKLPDKPPNGSAAYGPWWETEPATLAYGKALGMPARVGESMPDYRDRLRHAKPQTQRAAG